MLYILYLIMYILTFFSVGQSELLSGFFILIFHSPSSSRYEDSAGVSSPYALYEAAAVPGRHLNLVHVGCFPAGQRPASFLLCLLVFFLTPTNNILTPCGASACFLSSQNGSSPFSRSASFSKLFRCPGFKSTASAATQTQTTEEEDIHYNKGNIQIQITIFFSKIQDGQSSTAAQKCIYRPT